MRLALDIGGVHIKSAFFQGGACHAHTTDFALYRHPDALASHLASLFPEPVEHVLVTMTGELCDCFASRAQGVERILDAVDEATRQHFQPPSILIWSTDGRFITTQQARAQPHTVASSNWHALASFIARHFQPEDGLLIDVGSTTTDIIPLMRQGPATDSCTDFDRLRASELVYLGAQRTPLPMLAQQVELSGTVLPVMNEHFATTADLFVATAQSAEQPTHCDTPDGQPLTVHHAANRILRAVAGDLHVTDSAPPPYPHTLGQARELARCFIHIMKQRIGAALRRVIADRAAPREVFIAGSGEALAWQVVREHLGHARVHRLSDHLGDDVSSAACAYALLKLFERHVPAHMPPGPSASLSTYSP